MLLWEPILILVQLNLVQYPYRYPGTGEMPFIEGSELDPSISRYPAACLVVGVFAVIWFC